MTSVVLTQVPPLPNALPPEFTVSTTTVLSHLAFFDHSSLACASDFVPPMDDVHADTTSAVSTQEAAAHVLPLPTSAPREFPVLSSDKIPKTKKNTLRSANTTINRMIK